jgi:TPR repeat protein
MMNDDTDILSDDINKMSTSDDKLFQDPPPKEDCPLCMQPVPYAIGLCDVGTTYMPCCGKSICEGCVVAAHGAMIEGELNALCPFCRIRLPQSNDVNREKLKQCKQRMKLNDASAFYTLGRAYHHAGWGLPVDDEESMKWLNKAADFGHPDSLYSIANAYYEGQHGVDIDTNKAIQHYKLAAIGGHEKARYNLGVMEENDGNMDKAMKHYMIAAKSGINEALKEVREGYKDGHVTKDEYANTLRAYQVSVNEMKSVERDRVLGMRGV